MKCSEALKRLPERALGDLDAEPARDLAEHLKSCDSCRAQDARLSCTVQRLRSPEPAAPSTDRREAAVAAMARAHAERSEALLGRRPVPWIPWAAAAAFLLAVAAGFLLRPSGGPAFRVAHVSGPAELLDRATGRWRPVRAGETLSVSDRLVTHSGAVVHLEAGAMSLYLDQDTSMDVVEPRRVTLDRGRLCAVFPEPAAVPLQIADTANNFIAVRQGRVEAGLREVQGILAGGAEVKGGTSSLPKAQKVAARRLVARVGAGGGDLGGSDHQRLRADAGQEGLFDFGGKPSTTALKDPAVGAWIQPGYYLNR